MIDLLAGVLEQDLPPVVRGTVRLGLGKLVDSTGGDSARSRRWYEDAVADLDDRPDLKADAMIAVASHHQLWTPAEQRTRLHRALEILAELDDHLAALPLLGKVATVLVRCGDPAWRRLHDKVRDGAGDPMRRDDVISTYTIGLEACLAGHHETAARLLGAGLAATVTSESKVVELSLRTVGVLVDYCRGTWDGLPDTLEALRAELSGFPLTPFDSAAVAGCLALAHGGPACAAAAPEQLTELVRQAVPAGHLDLLPLPLGALARWAAVRGGATLVEGMDTYLAMVESGVVWPSTFRALPAVTQVLTVAGDLPAARTLVACCAAGSEGLDAPLAPAALHHARGHLAAAAGDWREAAQCFQSAADRYVPLTAPYEAAQAHEEAALALFALGDPRAEPTLRDALATYERLGARWDLERATSTARRHGVPTPARHRRGPRGYGVELSPREREVAELAAAGRTNREIASELFLSPNTVNKHLSAALRKLGLRSRNALAHRLGTSDQAAAGK